MKATITLCNRLCKRETHFQTPDKPATHRMSPVSAFKLILRYLINIFDRLHVHLIPDWPLYNLVPISCTSKTCSAVQVLHAYSQILVHGHACCCQCTRIASSSGLSVEASSVTSLRIQAWAQNLTESLPSWLQFSHEFERRYETHEMKPNKDLGMHISRSQGITWRSAAGYICKDVPPSQPRARVENFH